MDRIHHRLFNFVYDRSLLYNTCWEDPALDRVALKLTPEDTLAVITSAGCNVLDYALCGPRRIHAIDANPRQTALLELKIAGIRELEFDDFFAIFGEGWSPRYEELYHGKLRRALSPFAQQYWDRNQHWFAATGWRSSFYFHGLSGLVARLFQSYLGRHKRLRAGIHEMMAAPDLETQRHVYDTRVEPLLWTRGLNWTLSRQATMSLLGVPYAQRRELEASHSHGIAGFIRDAIAYVFRQLPLSTNYFWMVYLRGSYTRECCPEYLKHDNFMALKAGLVDAIVPHTCTVTDFLRTPGEPISRYILLDHMDWMSWYYPQALCEEWSAILDRATPEARVLFRSASPDPRYLEQVNVTRGGREMPLTPFLHFDRELAAKLHLQDRVHTYASFHIADIRAA
jgi:S-adenosylmethionine-diacylglycerol 3-amino-3-carboxypropyl transferase